MSTIFTKIISREFPAQFVYEDEICVVIMDKFPGVLGQTLVIPRQEVDYIFDLPTDVYHHMLEIANKVAKASDEAFATNRTCVVIEGFEVPHAHIKLYPMQEIDKNLSFVITNHSESSDAELSIQAEKIKSLLK
jgi:histidine triad (HIT) family protein